MTPAGNPHPLAWWWRRTAASCVCQVEKEENRTQDDQTCMKYHETFKISRVFKLKMLRVFKLKILRVFKVFLQWKTANKKWSWQEIRRKIRVWNLLWHLELRCRCWRLKRCLQGFTFGWIFTYRNLEKMNKEKMNKKDNWWMLMV